MKKDELIKENKELKDELKKLELENFSNKSMFEQFYKTSIKRGKTISLLLPTINQEHLTDMLAELYDLKHDKEHMTTDELIGHLKKMERDMH